MLMYAEGYAKCDALQLWEVQHQQATQTVSFTSAGSNSLALQSLPRCWNSSDWSQSTGAKQPPGAVQGGSDALQHVRVRMAGDRPSLQQLSDNAPVAQPGSDE